MIYIFPASAFVNGVKNGMIPNKDGALDGEVGVAKGIAISRVKSTISPSPFKPGDK